MRITSLVTIVAAALTATALPAPAAMDILAPRHGGGGGGDDKKPVPGCSNDNKPVCCQAGLLGLLECTVALLGGICEGSAYCCKTDAAAVSFHRTVVLGSSQRHNTLLVMGCAGSLTTTGFCPNSKQGSLINLQLLNCVLVG